MQLKRKVDPISATPETPTLYGMRLELTPDEHRLLTSILRELVNGTDLRPYFFEQVSALDTRGLQTAPQCVATGRHQTPPMAGGCTGASYLPRGVPGGDATVGALCRHPSVHPALAQAGAFESGIGAFLTRTESDLMVAILLECRARGYLLCLSMTAYWSRRAGLPKHPP
jgi:hypothetical protein